MGNSGISNPTDDNVIEIDPITHPPENGKLAIARDASSSIKTKSKFQQPSNTSNGAPSKGWILVIGAVIALLWAAGAVAYVFGMVGVQQVPEMPAAQMAGLIFGALGPALFIIVLSWAVREITLFAEASHQVKSMAERFADPAKFIREDAAAMADAVTTQMTQMNTSVEGALARLGAMEEVLHHHSKAFEKAEANARERTDNLINDLRREREAVSELADQLDQKAADIAATISEQSKMVVSAADIANAQTIESSKMLVGATRQLEQSAENASAEAAKLGQELGQATGQLDKTAMKLSASRQDIEASTSSLDKSQIGISEALAARRLEVRELIDVSEQCADRLKSAANDSAKEISQALGETLDQARHYTSIMREEGRSLADKHQSRAIELQNAAEQARKALDTYAEAITKRLEHANEASFTASSWADKTFDKLQEATANLDKQLQSLPATADASAREVEATLRKRLEKLNQASLQAADEARGIDEAFQSRIRQNYELLSDFMLKMGASASPKSAEIELPNPLHLRPKTTKAAPTEEQIIKDPPIQQDRQTKQPVSTEDDNKTIVEKKDGWRWKDVLSRIDRPAATASNAPQQAEPLLGENPVDRLVSAFQELQIQPDSLFDATSYRAAALARISNGHRTMADVVRVDAAGAIEQLHELFDRNESLRLDAQEFISELRKKVDQAANSGNQLHVETHLRTGDGPAYLLLEAALID